ncbi:Probable protein phosphatase 2C 14 [Linum perenne]
MARAFGDFCLKDYDLFSTTQIWDVMTNDEVINIVASVRQRSTSAKLLKKYVVSLWRTRHPGCRIDDCAVVCLFL